MSSETTVCFSVSKGDVLGLLLRAGLGRAEALTLMDVSEQSSTMLTTEDQRSSPTPADTEESQSARPSSTFERPVVAALDRLGQRLNDLSARVDTSDRAPSPSSMSTPLPTETTCRNWADISVDEVPDYSVPLNREDDPEDSRPTLQVSENTAKVLKAAFTQLLSNQSRLQTRKPFQFPDVEVAWCPKLLQREQKQPDTTLARLQSLVLDAVAPLTVLLEQAQSGSLTGEQVTDAAQAAITLLGNATTQISRERRKKVILSLNKSVHPLAEDEEVFQDAAPLLQGKCLRPR